MRNIRNGFGLGGVAGYNPHCLYRDGFSEIDGAKTETRSLVLCGRSSRAGTCGPFKVARPFARLQSDWEFRCITLGDGPRRRGNDSVCQSPHIGNSGTARCSLRQRLPSDVMRLPGFATSWLLFAVRKWLSAVLATPMP